MMWVLFGILFMGLGYVIGYQDAKYKYTSIPRIKK